MIVESPPNITSFHEITKRGEAHGGYNSDDKVIYVHGIHGEKCIKGIMERLSNKFKTRKFCFTPLINNNVESSIRGRIEMIPPDDPGNPFGEEIKCLWAEYEGHCGFDHKGEDNQC